MLTAYGDVAAAFREPGLWPSGSAAREEAARPDPAGNAQARTETLAALSSVKLAQWERKLAARAELLFGGLSHETPVDLVADFLRPFCLYLAAIVTGIDQEQAALLAPLSAEVAASAAEPRDPKLRARAREATAALQPCFTSGPASLREAGFVALSETLLRLLAGMWGALLQNPGEYARLRAQSELLPRAIEELMRHAGLARALYRTATEDVEVNGMKIARGERVTLCPYAANHDAAQFPEPERLEIDRRSAGHFSLGSGPHACAAAALLRMAAAVATRELVAAPVVASLVEPVEMEGGSGFESPRGLVVLVRAR